MLLEVSEYHTGVFLCTEKVLFLHTKLMKLLLNNPLFLLLPCVWGAGVAEVAEGEMVDRYIFVTLPAF